MDLVREETVPSGLIRGLVDLTVLGGVGLIVLGVVAKEGGVCVIKSISKPAVCGVNVGFKCAAGGVEHDTGVEGGAGGTDGVSEVDGAGGTQLQHWLFNFANNHRFRRIKIMMMVVTTAHASIPIKI